MVWKIALAAATAFMGANAVTTNYSSTVDPLNIVLPNIPQTTSLDGVTQCTYYNSPNAIVPAEWPTIWAPATSNGMNTSAEFTALYNSIDWTKAPNFPVRTLNANGGLDMTSYDSATDPACWWSSSTCKVPKTAGINADLYACPEPDVWGIVSYKKKKKTAIILFRYTNNNFRLLMMVPTVPIMLSMIIWNKKSKRPPCSILVPTLSTGLTVPFVVLRMAIILLPIPGLTR